jgi:molybdopterin biosynthesis enzyme MoaB
VDNNTFDDQGYSEKQGPKLLKWLNTSKFNKTARVIIEDDDDDDDDDDEEVVRKSKVSKKSSTKKAKK